MVSDYQSQVAIYMHISKCDNYRRLEGENEFSTPRQGSMTCRHGMVWYGP